MGEKFLTPDRQMSPSDVQTMTAAAWVTPTTPTSHTPPLLSPLPMQMPGLAEEPAGEAPADAGFKIVWSRVWKNQLTIFLNLFLTTLCYPGIITAIPCRQL